MQGILIFYFLIGALAGTWYDQLRIVPADDFIYWAFRPEIPTYSYFAACFEVGISLHSLTGSSWTTWLTVGSIALLALVKHWGLRKASIAGAIIQEPIWGQIMSPLSGYD